MTAYDPHELAAIHADVERRINLRPTVTPSTVSAARPVPPPAGPDRHGTTHAVTEARVERVSDDGC